MLRRRRVLEAAHCTKSLLPPAGQPARSGLDRLRMLAAAKLRAVQRVGGTDRAAAAGKKRSRPVWEDHVEGETGIDPPAEEVQGEVDDQPLVAANNANRPQPPPAKATLKQVPPPAPAPPNPAVSNNRRRPLAEDQRVWIAATPPRSMQSLATLELRRVSRSKATAKSTCAVARPTGDLLAQIALCLLGASRSQPIPTRLHVFLRPKLCLPG